MSLSTRSLSRLEVAEQLCAGGVALIDGRTFDISGELGRGNFGVVFEASARGVGSNPAPVAVKVSEIKGTEVIKEHLRTLLLAEIDVLRRLTDELRRCDPVAARHVPKYICHNVSPSKVVLAMTKEAGGSLDEWLYGMSTDDVKKTAPADWLEGKLPCGPGNHCHSVGLDSACGFATALLSQVAPVFSVLEGIGYHRDVSAHNFLVDDGAMSWGGPPDFTLIDLGLAVDAPQWTNNWQSFGVSGDPRYWSPAHIVHMVVGPKAVDMHHPDLACLYRERIDHYALGVVVLELVFGHWVGPQDEAGASGPMRLVVEARHAWRRYWSLAWTLFELMHSTEDPNMHAPLIVAAGLHVTLVDAHQKLCSALRDAAASVGNAFGVEVAALLLVAAELIDPASRLMWGRVVDVLGGDATPLVSAADAVFDRCRRRSRRSFAEVVGSL